jgi:hypothetical protein
MSTDYSMYLIQRCLLRARTPVFAQVKRIGRFLITSKLSGRQGETD